MDQLNSMTLPEFLDALAEQEAANGNDINAAYYRERALQWSRDQILLGHAQTQISDLTDRLQHIAEHAASPHAAPGHATR